MPKIKMTVSRVVDGKAREKGKAYDLAEPYATMVISGNWGELVTEAKPAAKPEEPKAEK